jgi:hypothetical protein
MTDYFFVVWGGARVVHAQVTAVADHDEAIAYGETLAALYSTREIHKFTVDESNVTLVSRIFDIKCRQENEDGDPS